MEIVWLILKKNPIIYFQKKSYIFSAQVDFVPDALNIIVALHVVICGLCFHVTI